MNRLFRYAIVLVVAFSIGAVPCDASEGSKTDLRIRIAKSGELVSVQLERYTIYSRAMHAIDAVQRCAPFPPLPEGAPEYVDFHFHVFTYCNGAPVYTKMRLCDKNQNARK